MTRHYVLSTALAVLFGVGGLSLAVAVEPTQPALTKQELRSAIANAKTPLNHQRVADYYKNEANRMLAEATEHDELAAIYAKSPNSTAMKQPMSGRTAEHCKYFADATRKAAQASQELAKMHEEMANQVR
jgi:hypothetical protein